MFVPLDAGIVVQLIDLNLVVEVADVADDRLVLHPGHVLDSDDIDVAGGGDVDVAAAESLLDGRDFVTFHRRLQRIDRIDLGDNDAGALAAQRLRTAFADVAVTDHHGDLAGDHHVERAVQAIDRASGGSRRGCRTSTS
jgi:hypothetical protein